MFGQNIELIRYQKNNCFGDNHIERVIDRISKVEKFQNDSFRLEIIVRANCCIGDFSEAYCSNDTLKIDYGKFTDPSDANYDPLENWEYCECDCLYKMNYVFKGHYNDDFQFLVNNKKLIVTEKKYLLDTIKFDILDNDTINKIDGLGLKQGLHIGYYENESLLYKVHYKNDTATSGFVHSTYFDNGKIRTRTFVNDDNSRTIKKFDEKGNIIKTCTYDINNLDEMEKCRENTTR